MSEAISGTVLAARDPHVASLMRATNSRHIAGRTRLASTCRALVPPSRVAHTSRPGPIIVIAASVARANGLFTKRCTCCREAGDDSPKTSG